MPHDQPHFKPYDTVRIRPSYPVPQVHGAKAAVARILPRSILVLLHDSQLRRTHGNLGEFSQIAAKHLHNLNDFFPDDRPYIHPPLVDELVATLPPRDRLPNAMPCPIHPEDTIYLRTDRTGRWWYSHKHYSPDFYFGYEWCKGYLNHFYQSKPWPDLPLTEDQ